MIFKGVVCSRMYTTYAKMVTAQKKIHIIVPAELVLSGYIHSEGVKRKRRFSLN